MKVKEMSKLTFYLARMDQESLSAAIYALDNWLSDMDQESGVEIIGDVEQYCKSNGITLAAITPGGGYAGFSFPIDQLVIDSIISMFDRMREKDVKLNQGETYER